MSVPQEQWMYCSTAKEVSAIKRAPSAAADGDGGDLDAAVDKVCYYSISILMYYIRIVP